MRDTSRRSELFERVLFPERGRGEAHPGSGPPAGLVTARRVATRLWLIVSLVNFVVWAMVCIISGSVDTPWWAWQVGAGGAVVGGLWLVGQTYRRPAEEAGAAQREFAGGLR